MHIQTEDTTRLSEINFSQNDLSSGEIADNTECFGDHHGQHTDVLLFYLTFLGLMVIFFLGAAYVEKHKPAFGHETGLTILVGVIISFLMWYWVPLEKENTF